MRRFFWESKYVNSCCLHVSFCLSRADYKKKGKIWLEYSDVVCHVVLLYSVDWTKACISFIFLTVNLFRNCTLIECEV